MISVNGLFAAGEARQALQNDLNVMLFSDNVSVEDELALKQLAHEKGLLMMGPDCGTAIINGRGALFW
ncbi:YahF/FdrA-like protein [Escherichia coli]|uniref:YahF/FdrA-like protein n=1 Tax=Escherichia coli TaxID=562 RepID=A0A376RQ65_ECOLX|nr:YahF/FdrA-like protein [Escherichia coli]